ncbi:hypothetical protein F4781DRAFT_432595 [Annulohypoxylon bovei var. microspora]|nr:hypothetical protein F4781DRAFT_432595 [Annulohypoxylon bovei var. microspora]
MVKENDVIAIIIIVLFIVLALIAFGIYRLVHMARTQGTISEESGSGSSVDARVDVECHPRDCLLRGAFTSSPDTPSRGRSDAAEELRVEHFPTTTTPPPPPSPPRGAGMFPNYYHLRG